MNALGRESNPGCRRAPPDRAPESTRFAAVPSSVFHRPRRGARRNRRGHPIRRSTVWHRLAHRPAWAMRSRSIAENKTTRVTAGGNSRRRTRNMGRLRTKQTVGLRTRDCNHHEPPARADATKIHGKDAAPQMPENQRFPIRKRRLGFPAPCVRPTCHNPNLPGWFCSDRL